MSGLAYGNSTLEMINQLKAEGISRMSVLIRHSARHYDHERPEREPFMVLTGKGKQYSWELGRALPEELVVSFSSSSFGRCIETAYLIDKGYVSRNGHTVNCKIEELLSPSYIKKPLEVLNTMLETRSGFIRHWFDGSISPDIIETPEKAAREILDLLLKRLGTLPENTINIGVSHDWNLYLLKEQIMGLKHEEVGLVEYLEGVVVYETSGQYYIKNHQGETGPL